MNMKKRYMTPYFLLLCLSIFLSLSTTPVLAEQSSKELQSQAKESIRAFKAAVKGRNPAQIRKTVMKLNQNPVAKYNLNNTSGHEAENLRKIFNKTMGPIKQSTRNGIIKDLSNIYKVDPNKVTFDEFTNPKKPGASTKVPQDWDLTPRVNGKPISDKLTKPIVEKNYYRAAGGKETFGKGSTPAKVAKKHGVEVIHPKRSPEAFPEVDKFLKGSKKHQFKDVRGVSEVQKYKNLAPKETGPKGDFKRFYETTKGHDKHVKPRVKAHGGKVPARLQKGIDIIRKGLLEGKSPKQIKVDLKAIDHTMESVGKESADLIEAAQKLKPGSRTGAKGKPAIVPSGGLAGSSSFTVTKGNTLKLTSTHTGAVGKAIGVAGITLMGLKVYDLYKYGKETGDWETVKEQGLQMASTTTQFMVGVKILTTAAPATAPVVVLAGTYAVAYYGTREIIERVPGAKKIDEVVYKTVEDHPWALDNPWNSPDGPSTPETQANVDLQHLLKNALKGGKWELPNGMTRAEAWKKALDNSNNRKKPVLGFLENVQARLKAEAETETLIKAAEEKLRMDSEKLKAELKAEEEARTKAQNEAKLKATAESPSATVSKTEVPPKKWADMTKDGRKEALTTGQDGAWKSHLDAIITAQKSEKVAETGGYDPTKDPGTGVTTDPTLIAKVDEISKKFQQETPTGQTSTQTNGALGGGSISPQSSAFTGGQIGGNSGATVGGGNVGAGIPITVGGIPTLGAPVPTTGGANVGGGTAAGTGAAKPGGATSGSGTGANVGGTSTGKQQCSSTEMCSVLPDSSQLGVNRGLMTQCSKQSGAQTTFTKSWSTGGGSRSVNITMTIYPTVAAAQADVQNYGASCGNGCTPVNIGNGGFKTTNITYPYFKIYSNNVVITYSSHKATRKAIPAQDNYISNIAQKINALNCQPSP